MRMLVCLVMICLLGAAPASAYVGPGLGLGAIGAFLGAVAAVLLAIVGFFWYPIKRLIRRLRGRDEDRDGEI